MFNSTKFVEAGRPRILFSLISYWYFKNDLSWYQVPMRPITIVSLNSWRNPITKLRLSHVVDALKKKEIKQVGCFGFKLLFQLRERKSMFPVKKRRRVSNPILRINYGTKRSVLWCTSTSPLKNWPTKDFSLHLYIIAVI